MKTFPLVLVAVMAAAASVRSQDATIASPTTARILGDIPDGTPPPPQPPKPEFIVAARDILETKAHAQGGRQIIVRKISPITLPPPPLAAPPVDIQSPALQERIAEVRAKHPGGGLIFVGATVFRSMDSPVRSLVRIWPDGAGEPVILWSSADFAYLSGFSSFVGSDGEARSLIMVWSTVDIDRMTDLLEKHGREYDAPEIPEFPAGKAAFAVTSGKPDDETLASIQSLHDLYNNEFLRLKAAYEGRERANRQREAELKANPPRPKDIILNHWRIETQAAEKGTAK